MKIRQIFLIIILISVIMDINAQKSNKGNSYEDIIVSARTGESVWINDSTLFEAPDMNTKDASGTIKPKISSSQRLTYDFLGHASHYYSNREPATVLISLDEKGDIVDWEILKSPFSRSVVRSYITNDQANFFYSPGKINGKPIKCFGILIFEMGPQENWRAGGPINSYRKTVSLRWSPVFE